MSNHRSLVAFTLLLQSAVGGIWCIGVALMLGSNILQSEGHARFLLLIILVGMGFSLGHLGRPAICFYSIRNLRYSWLSREIVSTVVLAAIVAVMAVSGPMVGVSNGLIVFVASVIGGFVVYAMSRAYRLRTVPPWNRLDTLYDFLASALLLGGIQFSLVLGVLAVSSAHGYDSTGPAPSRYVGLVIGLLGLVVKVGIRGTRYSHPLKVETSYGFSEPILQCAGLAMWVMSMLHEDTAVWKWTTLLLATILLAGGEMIQRHRFYGSYRSAGL
jgi:DMSO reductase anchor subunit